MNIIQYEYNSICIDSSVENKNCILLKLYFTYFINIKFEIGCAFGGYITCAFTVCTRLIDDVNPSRSLLCEARMTVRAARRSGEVLQVALTIALSLAVARDSRRRKLFYL